VLLLVQGKETKVYMEKKTVNRELDQETRTGQSKGEGLDCWRPLGTKKGERQRQKKLATSTKSK